MLFRSLVRSVRRLVLAVLVEMCWRSRGTPGTGRVVTGVLFDYRQSSLRNAENPKEVTGYVNVRVAEAWTVNLYGVVGFSRNSPDRGGGLVISYRWP